MNDESMEYIATPQSQSRPTRIDALLKRRMEEFLLERRRRLWQESGQ